MTEEEANLRALGADLAAAETSPWEPRCVVRAFRRPRAGELVYTMQAWMDLEDLRSPLLQGKRPTFEELPATFEAFGLSMGLEEEDPALSLSGEEIASVVAGMQRAIAEAGEMILRMERPLRPGEPREPLPELGMGNWLPTYACLVGQVGLSREDAKSCPVGEAHALIAAKCGNAGCEVLGMTYAQREHEEKEAARG